MNSTSDRKLTELLIARAFFKLSSIPARKLDSGDFTRFGWQLRDSIRGSQADPDTTAALFWLELFDTAQEGKSTAFFPMR